MAVLIFLGCLLGGIAIGLPIAWALLLCGAALMFWLDMFDVQIMAQTLVNGADSFSLLAIPFFVLAGEIMNAGGLSKRIVDLPMKLVGHKPGGLGYVGVLAAMIMASLSGSAVADTAAVAALLVPMMRSANYPVNRAAGLIASGGIIAPIIPPSIPFIIFGVSSGLSISKLFMAGIAPGMMMGATLMLTWWWQASRLNLPRQQKATMQEIWHSFVSGIWALFLPVIIIGGFRSGLFTPTEAGAVAAFYALFVATVIYREMTFATLWHVLIGAAKTTSVVMFLVASAQVSAWLITIAELPMMVSDLLQPLVDSPRLVVINKAKFDGLSPEFQQALVSSAQEAGNYQRKLVAEDQQKIIDGMKEAGVEVITDLDRKAFSDALGNQVRDMFVKDVPQGADLLKAVDEVQ